MANQRAHLTKAEQNLRNKMMQLDNTSKKIRFLHSHNKSIVEIETILFECGVTTRDNHPIRYQHVRNVLMTRLASEESSTSQSSAAG